MTKPIFSLPVPQPGQTTKQLLDAETNRVLTLLYAAIVGGGDQAAIDAVVAQIGEILDQTLAAAGEAGVFSQIAAAFAASAEAARDAAEDAVQYTYLRDDAAEIENIVGMVAGETAFARDTQHRWVYSGSMWVDEGPGPTAAVAASLERRFPLLTPLSAVRFRAADMISRYTQVIAGGADTNRPVASDYVTSTEVGGATVRLGISGTHVFALRQMLPLAAGNMVEIRHVGGSASNNPVDGSYEIGVAWFDRAAAQLSGGDAESIWRTIADVSDQSTLTDQFVIGRAAPFADLQAPAAARYAQPFVRITGSDGSYLVSEMSADDADIRVGLDRVTQWIRANDTPPTSIGLTNSEVDEAADVGTVVGLLTVSDVDAPGAASFSLTSNPGGLFAISGNRLLVADTLTEGQASITVRAEDWLGNVLSRALVITVVDNLFTPASLPEALFVLDTEFFTDAAGTVPASVGDRVRYVRDNAGGSNFFTTPSLSRRPWLRADENGRLYLENPQDEELQQRLTSDAPILPDSKEWYFGIVCAADDDRYVPLFAQRSFASYDAPGNFQIQLNSNWGTSGITGAVFLDRVLAYIQGATDGLQAPSTGPGIGQPRNGFLERGKPVLVEVIAREGHLASEVRFNGLLHDRFTMNENTAQEVCWILNNQGAASGGSCRLYNAAALAPVPDLDNLWKTRRWLLNRGGVDLGYGVGELPRIWSPRAIALAPDGTELAALDPDALASAASIAKAMSALTAFRLLGMLDPDEDTALDTVFEVTEGDANISPGSSTAQLQGGDLVSLRDLLYGMALPSGNDAARCVARVFGGMLKELDGDTEYSVAEARSRFVAEMNALSDDIGLVGATWTNPVGGADQRVSARHCAQMFRVLIEEYPTAADIFSAQNRTMTVTGPNARTYNVTSTNALLQRGETWAEACKTGTLGSWGASAVLSWETDTGETIVQVNMGALNNSLRWGDQQVIRDVVLRDWEFVDGEPVPTR